MAKDFISLGEVAARDVAMIGIRCTGASGTGDSQ